jgi:hypothetical protein
MLSIQMPAERAEQGQRQRQHDHERMAQALELRGQHHVNNEHRQDQHPHRFGGAFLDLVRFAIPPITDVRRQQRPRIASVRWMASPSEMFWGWAEMVTARWRP